MTIFETLVLSQRTPGVAQITMARPAVFNAFDELMIGELDAAFAELIEDASVRVIVLAGEFGGNDLAVTAGATAEALDAVETDVDVTDG